MKKHICKPKLTKVNFFCDNCGRVAVEEGEVCKPKAIEG
jgi:predicted RNA-binding Zn-ribbon protein involved in translation (DUF1610 family)